MPQSKFETYMPSGISSFRSLAVWITTFTVIGTIYAFAARIGFLLAFDEAYLSAIWPQSGIALAAILIFGFRVWPGIFIGAFFTNAEALYSYYTLDISSTVLASFVIALGNTWEAVFGAYFLRKLIGHRNPFDRPRNFFSFFVTAVFMVAINCSVGPAILCLSKITSWHSYSILWLSWWLGGLGGILIFTPFILTWWKHYKVEMEVSRVFESGLFLVSIFILCHIVFDDWLQNSPINSQAYLLLPLLLWAAFRFGQRETTSGIVIIAWFTIWGTLQGYGPFALQSLGDSLILMQGFLCAIAVTMLALGASLKQQKQMAVDLQEINETLEERVKDRTETLAKKEELLRESQGRLQAILDNSAALIFLKDLDGRYILINRSFQRMLGVTSDQVKGKKDSDIFPQEIADVIRSNDEKVKQSGEIIECEELIPHNGERRTYLSVKFPIRDSVSKVIALAGMSTDITDRKKTEEQLKKQATALENAANVINITDEEGTIQWINPAFTETTGYSKEEVVGKNPRILKSGKQDAKFYENLWKTITAGKIWSGELINRKKDGTYYYADLTITPVLGSDGSPISYVGISQDVTQRKEAEERLINQKEALERANRELDSFVYTASHDLRAPLRGISSFATFLEEDYIDKLDEEGKEFLMEIRKGADRMSMLIEDLLTLSRISRIQNPYEDADIKEMIDSVLDRVTQQIRETKAEIKIAENIPIIRCDPIKVKEVFANLITNAIKFSSKDGKKPIIDIGYQELDSHYQFSVKDNGIGIAEEFHEKIFGMFKRLHSNAEFEGTGAGLSIVQRVIDEHQGRIWVDSEEGKGTTFNFTITKNIKEKKRLGQILVEDGLVTEEQIKESLKKQKGK